MTRTRKIFLFVALPLVVLFIALALWLTRDNSSETTDSNATTANNPVSAIPKVDCDAIVLKTPTDISKVSSVLYPGQVRGGDYKPHGGFRLDSLQTVEVTVVASLDASVSSASRYLESNEIQYLFEFKADCGLKYRFDHLKTLSAKLQAVVEQLPAAKVGDSRTTEIKEKVSVTAGEIVATAVGHENAPDGTSKLNISFDFGLYDTRQKNEASKDSAWVAAHQEDGEQAIYGVCWLDWLPTADATILKALPAADGQSGKTSDYCK